MSRPHDRFPSLRPVAAAVGLLLVSILLEPAPSRAQWLSGGEQLFQGWYIQGEAPVRVPDAAGGLISFAGIANGFQVGHAEIAASHVTPDGVRDWASCPNCSPPVSFLTFLMNPPFENRTMVSAARDVDGFSYAAWYDTRGGVYAQKVKADGTPLWLDQGVLVQSGPISGISVCDDLAGGAYVGMRVGLVGGDNPTIVRLTDTGAVAAGFPAPALVLPFTTNAWDLKLVGEPAGGCYAVWLDNQGVRYQHVSPTGNRDLGPEGMLASSATGSNAELRAVPSPDEGVYLAWTDSRSGAPAIYVQHIDSAGDPVWTVDGVFVANGSNASIAADPATGDLLVGWCDTANNLGLVARLDPVGGTVMAPWTVTNADEIAVGSDSRGGMLMAATHSAGYLIVMVLESDGSIRYWTYLQNGSYAHPFVATDGDGGAMVTWTDAAAEIERAIRFRSNGGNDALYPNLTAVVDEPADEGGQVALTVAAPPADYQAVLDSESIYGYGVWRLESAVAAAPAAAPITTAGAATTHADLAARLEAGAVRLEPAEAAAMGMPAGTWVSVGFHAPLHGPTSYTFLAPTRTDSTGAGPATETFAVTSHTLSGIVTTSSARSGFSVDNLAPAAPANLVGQYAAGAIDLSWAPSTAADLAGYAVYRGTDAGFTPAPANRLAQPAGTTFTDPQFDPAAWYKVAAVDRHGNESASAVLGPRQVSGVGESGATQVSFLDPLQPNPGNGAGTVVFGLRAPARVTLAVYDVRGRRVRQLLDGVEDAGRHVAAWDGCDEGGRPLASGTYVLKLEGPGLALSRKLTRLR